MEVYDEGNVWRLDCSVRIKDAVRLYVDTARCFPISTELFSNMSLPLSYNIDISPACFTISYVFANSLKASQSYKTLNLNFWPASSLGCVRWYGHRMVAEG